MTDTPLISVVMPAYNHEKYINIALQTIITQDYPRLEIIVVDDGSTDGTGRMAKNILGASAIPYHLIRQENQGAHAALNHGIQISNGEYIAILNSDDRYLPERLSVMLDALKASKQRFAYSKVSHIDSNGSTHPYQEHYLRQIAEASQFPALSFELLRNNIAASTSNFLFRRDLVDEVGGFNALVTCHDWDFLLRVLLIEEPLFIDEVLLEYRIHTRGTLQLNLEKVNAEVELIMVEYLDCVSDAKNPLAPGPLQWGEYWNFYSANYLERIRALPSVAQRLDSLKKGNINFTDAEKYRKVVEALEYQAGQLRKLEEQLADTDFIKPGAVSSSYQAISVRNGLRRLGKRLHPPK